GQRPQNGSRPEHWRHRCDRRQPYSEAGSLTTKGKPPALPGDSQNLTVLGIGRRNSVWETAQSLPQRESGDGKHETLKPTKWDCKYHGVCIPTYRRKALYKEWRQHLGVVLWDLTSQKACRIEEGHLLPDPVYMLWSILSQYAVAHVVGF